MACAIHAGVFGAVRDPEIVHARRAQRTPQMRAHGPGATDMLLPETPHAFVFAAERETRIRERMREERGVEVQADSPACGPVRPSLKMDWLQSVVVHTAFAEFAIHGMEVHPVLAGNQRKDHRQVCAQLLRIVRTTRTTARHLDSAGEPVRARLEARDIVPLPAGE